MVGGGMVGGGVVAGGVAIGGVAPEVESLGHPELFGQPAESDGCVAPLFSVSLDGGRLVESADG
ncbi:MAG TPA: hypothetical protein VFW66_09885 [Gemmatimonadales bacterium]|nr:hypothetical protein [Gemmatimonadales bacterium]